MDGYTVPDEVVPSPVKVSNIAEVRNFHQFSAISCNLSCRKSESLILEQCSLIGRYQEVYETESNGYPVYRFPYA